MFLTSCLAAIFWNNLTVANLFLNLSMKSVQHIAWQPNIGFMTSYDLRNFKLLNSVLEKIVLVVIRSFYFYLRMCMSSCSVCTYLVRLRHHNR